MFMPSLFLSYNAYYYTLSKLSSTFFQNNNKKRGWLLCTLCYYNSITCVRGHSWDRLEGEKNVKGLQAGRNLTWEHPKNIQQNQWLRWTNWEEHKSNPASKPLHNSNTPPKNVPNPSPLTVKILYPSRPQSHKPSNFQRFPGRGAHQKCQWYQWHTGDS